MIKMKKIIFIVLTVAFISTVTNAQMQRKLFGFGAEAGTIANTVGGSNFAMAFNADYLMGENFSIAGIVSFIPAGTLTQFNPTVAARFNIPVNDVDLIPYLGVGLTYAKYEGDRSISFAFPLGFSVGYYVAENIQVTGRIQFSLYNLDFGIHGTDDSYMEIMAGFRFTP
jgi:hypothetical protein